MPIPSEMSTSPTTRGPSRRGWSYEWLLGAIGLAYLISLVIIILVLVTLPEITWGSARTFKIVGLSFNVGGAFASLAPRASRNREQIEQELAMTRGRERLWFDTMLARWGIVVFGVGFIQQLIGNLLG